jgi:hypothetical protein
MAFKACSEKELQKTGIKVSNSFPLSGTSLASLESLSLPLVCSFGLYYCILISQMNISLYHVINA